MRVMRGVGASFPYFFRAMLYCFSWMYPRNGARPVPAPTIITFFHLSNAVKVDLRSSARMLCGFWRKKLEMRPLGTKLAATITFLCVREWEAMVKSLGAIESES